MRQPFLILAIVAASAVFSSAGADAQATNHPRLFFTPSELTELRARKADGFSAVIYANLTNSADWCLTRPMRTNWIAPITPDPNYTNLYDRFYATMHDMAVMEHLAFAWAYSEDQRYLAAAKAWTLACARIWQQEADGAADASKAYAVLRLLKGVATAYDMIYADLTEAERIEIRGILAAIGDKYYQWYLDNPTCGTVAQGPHHASVETASFGIAALALLDEVPASTNWLQLMVAKHRTSLLPYAIDADGAQVEGATFWASTMQYRIAFMDALRRVTGTNLFTEFPANMDSRLALASIAASKTAGGYDQDNETVVLEPDYGQINYYSPVLLALARVYRKPLDQYLALWDRTAGSVEQTRYITHSGEWLLFDWGGYAYAWYDPTVTAAVEAEPLSFTFPSVNQAYLRTAYASNGIVAGMWRKSVVIHAGGRPVYVELSNGVNNVSAMTLQEAGTQAVLTCTGGADSGFTSQTLRLQRPGRLTMTRETTAEQAWWCYGTPVRSGNTLRWQDGTELEVIQGTNMSLDPAGYHDEKVTGMGLLKLDDPMPMTYPLVKAQPLDGRLVVEIRLALAPPAPDAGAASQGNIDRLSKYAWSENSGWQNWRTPYGGVTVNVAGGYLSGYAWGENIGWVKLGSGAGPYANTASNNYGVNMDAAGELSGYAWSEACGWVSFSNAYSQVAITAGSFDGYAWAENIGWIHFKNASPQYNLRLLFNGFIIRSF